MTVAERASTGHVDRETGMAAETEFPQLNLDNLIPLNETANGETVPRSRGRANQRCRARSFLRY